MFISHRQVAKLVADYLVVVEICSSNPGLDKERVARPTFHLLKYINLWS
jgi:hypothetical protein